MKEKQTGRSGRSRDVFVDKKAKATSVPRFFTVQDVALICAVSLRSVRRWIARNKLVAHHFGNAVRIAESDLQSFIASRRDC